RLIGSCFPGCAGASWAVLSASSCVFPPAGMYMPEAAAPTGDARKTPMPHVQQSGTNLNCGSCLLAPRKRTDYRQHIPKALATKTLVLLGFWMLAVCSPAAGQPLES